MRFKFCGDLDCPDWVLAEINILARLSSVKMKLLVNQVVKGLLGEKIDFQKVEKLTSDAKFDVGDIKASVAGIEFIISSATKYDVEAQTLSSELQQLGLPKEHSSALCKVYDTKQTELHAESLRQSFRCSPCLMKVDWKINPSAAPGVERKVDIRLLLVNPRTNKQEAVEMTAGATKLKVLLYELKQVRNQMTSLKI